MKVIKLDGRHNLKRKGYSWAFRFKGWSTDAGKVESTVKKLEGWHWDCTFWGKDNGNGYRPYYVGIKKESTVTMALLSLK